MRNHFFVINPKSLLNREELETIADYADTLAQRFDHLNIFFTSQHTELENIKKKYPNLIVTAQHADDIAHKESMGVVSIRELSDIGVNAVVLNHAEKPLTISALYNIIQSSKKYNIKTIVCANAIEEAKAIALLDPDILLAEQTDLIGSGNISNDEYIISITKEIKKVNPYVLIEQAAGIKTEEDVKHMLDLGADGVGVTSGIVKARNPLDTMEKMIEVVGNYERKSD